MIVAGAGIAFAFTYALVRRVFFRDQELQAAVKFSKGLPEARTIFSEEELQEAAKVHFQATFFFTVAMAVIGWAMFLAGLMKYQQ